jgi:hypothetical protein
MHWHIQPLIWVAVAAIAALLAIPRAAHPEAPSAVVRRACDGDVRRLCPAEHRAKDSEAVGRCMRAHAGDISIRCTNVWMREHPPNPLKEDPR